MNNYIYCYYITKNCKIPELLVSYTSLKATNPKYPIAVVVGDEITTEDELFLKNVGLIVLDAKKYAYSETIYNEDGSKKSEFICSGKLSIYRFLEYDKIVYLDTDTYVFKNMDELFDCKDGSMAKVNFDDTYIIPNGGLLVCVPNKYTVQALDKAIQDGYAKGEFDYYDDQEFLQVLYDYSNRPDLKISYIYNMFPFYINVYRNQLIFDEKCAKMIHLMGHLTVGGVKYKPYEAENLSLFPMYYQDYLIEYLRQYNLIITLFKLKYPNYAVLKKCALDVAFV